MNECRLLRVREVQTQLGFGRTKVYTLLDRELPTVRVGRSVRVSQDEVQRFIERNTVREATPQESAA